jgi:GPH family glycoside/pentoside/hexuronide:cation symporter
MTDTTAERVPLGTIVIYGLPSAGIGFMFFLTSMYLMKFATDVLLMAPAVMGLLFGASRIWDAISDPLAGHLSDRTRSRLGRRRSWLLLSVPPLVAGNLMLWGPPVGLEGTPLAVWMGTGLFILYTALTMFSIPHDSLGAELSTGYHDRTRIFGIKHMVGGIGSLLAVGVFQLLLDSEAARGLAFHQALLASLVTAALILLAVARLRERQAYQGRGGRNLFGALRDVVRNEHARLLLAVFAIENVGTAVLAIVIPYAMEYVLDVAEYTGLFILLYFVPSLLFVPVWIRLSRTFGKRNLWVFSMSVMSIAFGGLYFVEPGDVVVICGLGLLAGVGGGCGQVVGPSLQADIIDFDEYRTGERKEGAYFSIWNFVRKSAFGIVAMVLGLLLSASGFVPNVEQNEETKAILRALFSFLPGACYALGTLIFLRFRFDETAHAAVRRDLDARG